MEDKKVLPSVVVDEVAVVVSGTISKTTLTPPRAQVEHWARAKGMIPEFTDGEVSPARLKRAPRSPKPKLHNPKYALWARTRDSLRWDPTNWPVMTEAEFDKAVAATALHAYH